MATAASASRPPCALRPCRRRRRRHRCIHAAALAEAAEPLGGGLAAVWGAGALASAAATLYARGAGPRDVLFELEDDDLDEAEEEDEEGALPIWGVAAVVSCVPYASPLAWLAAGLASAEDGEWRVGTRLWLTAALYAAPYLRCGLALDGSALACVAVGAAHLQLERHAAAAAARRRRVGGDAGAGNRRRTADVGADGRAAAPAALVRAATARLAETLSERRGPEREAEDEAEQGAGAPTLGNSKGVAVDGTGGIAKRLGYAVGELAESARDIREGVEAGRLAARLRREEEEAASALAAQQDAEQDALQAFDARMQLRTMTRPQLLAEARSRGLSNYSKLRKADLIKLLEDDRA